MKKVFIILFLSIIMTSPAAAIWLDCDCTKTTSSSVQYYQYSAEDDCCEEQTGGAYVDTWAHTAYGILYMGSEYIDINDAIGACC